MDADSTSTRPTSHTRVSHGGRPFAVWLVILYAAIAGAVGLIYTPLVLVDMVPVLAPERALLDEAGIVQCVISLGGGLLCVLLALSLVQMRAVAVRISVILLAVSAVSFLHHFFRLDYESQNRMHVFLGSAAFNLSLLLIIVLYVRRLRKRGVLTSGPV